MLHYWISSPSIVSEKSPENISNTLLKMKLPIIYKNIRVKVTPNTNKTEIKAIENNILKINLKAPPEKDKANKELIKFFKKQFKLNVKIKTGKTNREKILEIV